LGFGVGLANCGTNFKILPTGPLAYISEPRYGTEKTAAFRLHAGIQMKPLKASVIFNFVGRESLGLPKKTVEAKLTYTISPFAKGKEIQGLQNINIFKTKMPEINIGMALCTKDVPLEGTIKYPRPTNGKYLPLHDATPRLFVDISKKLKGRNNLIVNLSNYISYVNIGGDKKVNKFKRDHFVDIINQFKTKKENTKILFGVGFGMMNCGTNYKYVRTFSDSLGMVFASINDAKSSQRFNAARLIIGLQKNNFKGSLIAHATPEKMERKELGQRYG
jgi:hypothetical protein